MKRNLLTLIICIYSYCIHAQTYLPITGGTLTGELQFDAPDGTFIRLRTNGNPTGFMSNTYNAIGSGSKDDLLTWVYGNNPYGIWTNGSQRITVDGTGNVGVGTTSPVDLLHLNAGAHRKGITINSDGDANAYTDVTIAITTQSAVANGTPIGWDISHRKDGYFSDATGGSSLEFYAYLKGGNYYAPMSFKPNGDVIMVSPKNALGGNVAIGTTDPQGYKLAVNGNIRAKEVKVETGWSDYVFYPTYKLRSLSEVANYIKINQHLPDVPSAAEVEKNGINVGETNALLLKKIEELTLYLIEKDKQVINQQSQIDELKKQVEQLSKLIKAN